MLKHFILATVLETELGPFLKFKMVAIIFVHFALFLWQEGKAEVAQFLKL